MTWVLIAFVLLWAVIITWVVRTSRPDDEDDYTGWGP